MSAEVSPVTRTSANALVWVSSTSKQLNGLQEQKEKKKWSKRESMCSLARYLAPKPQPCDQRPIGQVYWDH